MNGTTADPGPSAAPPAEGTEGAADFFGTQVTRWILLYETCAAFRDRLQLFTQSVTAVQSGPARILDFGCGPGIISMALAGAGHQVLGLDASSGMIAAAQREAERRRLSTVRFEVMDDKARLMPDAYDVIVCSSVIEYVREDHRLMLELVRALRPGGHLLVSVPHRGSLTGLLEDLLKRVRSFMWTGPRSHRAFSLRRYPRRRFLQLLREAGLTGFSCTYFDFPVLSRHGVALSRLRWFGLLMLVVARKGQNATALPEDLRQEPCADR